ncbi:glycosyltransferase [bacterium]|nr:glycosyltransferase [bacterium]
MQISAIIPTRGRIQHLLRAIDSVRRQAGVNPIELIVIDDASDPPLPDLPKDVNVIHFQDAVGACKARNAGAAVARGELLLFLDDDAELETDAIAARSLQWFESRPQLAAIGYRQLTTTGDIHYMQPCQSEVPALSGLFFSYGCMLRRDVYESVNGFNELFEYYYEENELSLKIYVAGFEILYDPELLVRHHQDSLHRNHEHILRVNTRNAIISYLQHYPILLCPPMIGKCLVQNARQRNIWIVPIADIIWLVDQILRRRRAICHNRRSVGCSTVFQFHALCRKSRRNPTPVRSPLE